MTSSDDLNRQANDKIWSVGFNVIAGAILIFGLIWGYSVFKAYTDLDLDVSLSRSVLHIKFNEPNQPTRILVCIDT